MLSSNVFPKHMCSSCDYCISHHILLVPFVSSLFPPLKFLLEKAFPTLLHPWTAQDLKEHEMGSQKI